MAFKFLVVENDPKGVKWLMSDSSSAQPTAYCTEHDVPLVSETYKSVYCPADHESFEFRNDLSTHRQFVRAMAERSAVRDLEISYIDTEGARVLAKEVDRKNSDFWIDTKVTDTSKGVQIMVQVGKKDQTGKKVQLFVDSPRKRLGFDLSDKDDHPSGILAEVTATFKGSETKIKAK